MNLPINPLTGLPMPPPVADIPLYYENGKGFRHDDGTGKFSSIAEAGAIRLLVKKGYSRRALPPAQLSAVESALLEIQTTKVVDFVGPLAGRVAGLYEIDGKKVLVTGSPRIIEPDPNVEWHLIKRILDELLGADPAQLTHLFGWLKIAYTALRTGANTAHGPDALGQAIAVAGPAGSGKTLLQHIIKEILGGRSANPFNAMSDKTNFNADLLGAECLMFGDEQASTHMNARRAISAKLKQLIANGEHRCEGKFANALTLRPFWRVTMTLNDEPENIVVLPPLDESIADKLMLFKAQQVQLFATDLWSTDRSTNMTRLRAELPGFLSFLVSEFQIPAELRDHRFGIRAYHHPDLLRALGKLSSEHRLLELIDASSFFAGVAENAPPRRLPVEGKAADIERKLLIDAHVGTQAKRLLGWDAAAGTYLSRLAKTAPARVSVRTLHGHSVYVITPPPELSSTSSNAN